MLNTDLCGRAQSVLPGQPSVRRAFIGIRGPRPGAEALSLLAVLGATFVIPTGSTLSAALVGGVIGGGVAAAILLMRRHYTIAMSDQSAFVLRNGRFRSAQPVTLESTLSRTDTIAFREGGDRSVEINGARYWVIGNGEDEARKAIAEWSQHEAP